MNNKWLPWIIGALLTIAIAVSGYGIGRIDSVNSDLQAYKLAAAKDSIALAKEQVMVTKEYVLKDDFRNTVDDLKKQLGKMDDKLDTLMKEVRNRK